MTEKIQDYKFWKLIGRVKHSLGEDIKEVKEIKLKEINALMKINWHVELETCELIETSIGEMVERIFPLCPATTEEI